MSIKKILKIIKKIVLWTLGIWIGLLLILQIVMLPPIFTPIANSLANKFVNANVSIGRASGSVLKRFPRISISLEDLKITYPHERFDSLSRTVAQNELLYCGCGEKEDTLASFRKVSASISLFSLIKGEVKLPEIEVHCPTIYAHSYDAEHANWNIFGSSQTSSEKSDTTISETSSSSTSSNEKTNIILNKIRITGKPKIVYTDSQDSLFVLVNIKDASFDGHFETAALHKLMANASINNIRINGRHGSDTLTGKINTISLKPQKTHMRLSMDAQAYAQAEEYQLLPIPVNLLGDLSLAEDEGTAISLHNLQTNIGTIPGEGKFDVKLRGDSTVINGHFNIQNHNLQGFMNSYGSFVIPGAECARSNTTLTLQTQIEGAINHISGTLPMVKIDVDIPDSYIDHESFPKPVDLGLCAHVKMDKSGQIYADSSSVNVKTYGLDISGTIRSYPFGQDDRKIEIKNGKLYASLDSLIKFSHDTSNVKAQGRITANLNGSTLMSYIDMYKFSRSDLHGKLESQKLVIDMPMDSIKMNLSGLNIGLHPKEGHLENDGSIEITGSLKDVDINSPGALVFNGRNLRFDATNSANQTDSTGEEVKEIKGNLNVDSLFLQDYEGTIIQLGDTRNRFKINPSPEDHKILEFSLTDNCSSITYLTRDNQVYLKGSKIIGEAKEIQDHDKNKHQDIARPADKEKRKGSGKGKHNPRKDRHGLFERRNLMFSINEIVQNFFSGWEIESNVSADKGIVNTNQLPFTNVINGVGFKYKYRDDSRTIGRLEVDSLNVDFLKKEHLKLDSHIVDWQKIDSTKTVSGKLEIYSDPKTKSRNKSFITGLKKGNVRINMNVRSEFFNADELFFADTNRIQEHPQTSDLSKSSSVAMTSEPAKEEISTKASSSLFIIPRNIQAKINLDMNNVRYKDTDISKIKTTINIKDRCAQIIGSEFKSEVGNAYLDAFYYTRKTNNIKARKLDNIKAGLCLDLENITSERLIALMPEISSMMPMIQSVHGKLNCEIAATTELDKKMSIKMSTLKGITRIKGTDLGISNNEAFTDVAKKLRFKNRDSATIDNLLVESSISDGKMEIYPFLLDIDRYKLGVSGIQNMDMSFQHHISVLRSPFGIRFGINISGQDYGHMKYRPGRAKYRINKLPSFSQAIDDTKNELSSSIKNVLNKDVDKIIILQHIQRHQKETEYVNAALQELEELPQSEMKRLEDIGNAEEAVEKALAKAAEIVKNILNKTNTHEQSGIH